MIIKDFSQNSSWEVGAISKKKHPKKDPMMDVGKITIKQLLLKSCQTLIALIAQV